MKLQTEVLVFLRHFPTHSTVWEVYETTYDRMQDISVESRDAFFTGRDGTVYLTAWPDMMSRERATEYAYSAPDTTWIKHTVIEIS